MLTEVSMLSLLLRPSHLSSQPARLCAALLSTALLSTALFSTALLVALTAAMGCAGETSSPEQDPGVSAAATHTELDIDVGDIPIWRLQVCLETADIKNAGTDDRVYVYFNGRRRSMTGDQRDGYRLNLAGDDFERGQNQCFDIHLAHELPNTFIRDLNSVTVGKEGGDAWCLESYRVVVNSRVDLWNGGFPRERSGCHWLNRNGRSEVELPRTRPAFALADIEEMRLIVRGEAPLYMTIAELEARHAGALQAGILEWAHKFRWDNRSRDGVQVAPNPQDPRYYDVTQRLEWRVGDWRPWADNRETSIDACDFLPNSFCRHGRINRGRDGTFYLTLDHRHRD